MTRVKVDFNEEKKLCWAEIAGKYGTFTAYVKCAEEDEWQFNKFTGCNYAEIKATLKYLQAKEMYQYGKYVGAKHICKNEHDPQVQMFYKEYKKTQNAKGELRAYLQRIQVERDEYMKEKYKKS